MYADDLLLLALSLKDLQSMVDICCNEFDALDLQINFKKSICIRIGKRHNEKVAPLIINNQALVWKQELRYLGVFVVSANTFDCNLQTARQKFYKALNGIFAKIGTHASPATTLSLVNSYCLPVLLYGTEALLIKSKVVKSLENAYRAAFAKIFHTFNNDIIVNCQYYCNMLPLSYIIDIRHLNFYNCLQTTSNDYLKLHFLRSGSRDFKSLLNKYNLKSSDSRYCFKSKLWTAFAESLQLA
jgi:hypothetical protein